MRWAVVLVSALGACSFGNELRGPAADAAVDAPPTTPFVRFVSITSMQTELRPGLYGFEVVAVLRNELPTEVTNVAATLTFAQGAADRTADFRWRDVDARDGVIAAQPATIAAGAEATFRFVVDALPWAVPPGPIEINGAATVLDGGVPLTATPAMTALALPFAELREPIVVDHAGDELDLDDDLCLREALVLAAVQSGFDRIVFDPAVFPPGAPAVVLLADDLGELTVGQDVVIDGHGAGVILAVDTSWENDSRYALRITSGNVVVSHLVFRNFGYGYQAENLSSGNCGSGNFDDGGAIRIDGGTVMLEGNRFEDPDVAERNCFAASLRIEGGSGHRILDNTWTAQVMDSIYVDAATREISGNVMNAGSDLAKVDECIFIASQGGQPLWITGNICADMEYSAVIAGGGDSGTLHVVHNTFVRNGRTSSSAVRRTGGRTIWLRNNVYVGNKPSAIALDSSGNGFDVAYETTSANPLFSGASSGATVNTGSVIDTADPGFTNGSGSTRADLAPVAGSPLIGSGIDVIDTNGGAPRRFGGAGPERGAVELP